MSAACSIVEALKILNLLARMSFGGQCLLVRSPLQVADQLGLDTGNEVRPSQMQMPARGRACDQRLATAARYGLLELLADGDWSHAKWQPGLLTDQ